MAPPRRAAATRGRTRRRVRKNIAIGQAHIKTSFNNTIVALTDQRGQRDRVGVRRLRRVQGLAQVDAVRRAGHRRRVPPARAWSTASRRSRSSSRARAPAARPRSARSRPPASRSWRQGRHPAGAQRCPPAQAEARLMARDLGPKCRICRREGMKLFLKGERCLTEKCAIERRCVPAG